MRVIIRWGVQNTGTNWVLLGTDLDIALVAFCGFLCDGMGEWLEVPTFVGLLANTLGSVSSGDDDFGLGMGVISVTGLYAVAAIGFRDDCDSGKSTVERCEDCEIGEFEIGLDDGLLARVRVKVSCEIKFLYNSPRNPPF
jgi:hypothetical protein